MRAEQPVGDTRRTSRGVDGGYGWVAVGSAFVAHMIAFGVIYSFTVFFPSILSEFGQGRGRTAWVAATAATLMLGAGGVVGRLSDRYGPGLVIAAGGVLVGAGLLATSLADALWQVLLAYGLLLGLGASCAFVPSVATVAQWFERRRGLATGVAVAGTGVGTLILAPLSAYLVDAHGWRSAMRILAALSVVALAGAGSVMRARVARSRIGGALAIARESGPFRLMWLSFVVASYGYWVPFVHIVPYARDAGISAASAAALVSIAGVTNTLGRIVMGAAADRFGRRRMLVAAGAAMTIAMFTWPLATAWSTLALFSAFYGLFAGAFIALLPALAGDYFGVDRLAGITGLLFTGAAVGTLFGAPVTGLLFDAQGSYTLGILLAATALAAGTGFLVRLREAGSAG